MMLNVPSFKAVGQRCKLGLWLLVVALAAGVSLAGCTVHPAGEAQLRRQAQVAGRPFAKPYAQRHPSPLPFNATPGQLVHYALRNNPQVQQYYWQWRVAIENIPQAGTQTTTLMLNAGTLLSRGSASLANTTAGAANMGSADVKWPSKLSADAKAALLRAVAAEWNYRSRCFALRRNVLDAWYGYTRTAVLLELVRRRQSLLQSVIALNRAGIKTGTVRLQRWLSGQNRLDLLRSGTLELTQQLPRQLAALNALLGRPANTPLKPSQAVARVPVPARSNEQLLAMAVRRNPKLQALGKLAAAGRISMRRAKMQYIPNFALGLSTSLEGTVQNITGALVVPALRYQAIDASIRQARDQLRATRASWREQYNNLASRLLIDLIALRNDHRQLRLFRGHILPRWRMLAALTRAAYQQGGASADQQLGPNQTMLQIQQTIVDLQTDQNQRVADLDAIVAEPMERGALKLAHAAPRSDGR